MSATEEFTYEEVSKHTSKKDLHFVINGKVYNASTFIDEHPGGEEVLLDVGGQDATEAFEDVGHSDEAREILDGLIVGKLKRVEGDPAPKHTTTSHVSAGPNDTSTTSLGVGLYAAILVGGAVAYAAYKYLQVNEVK